MPRKFTPPLAAALALAAAALAAPVQAQTGTGRLDYLGQQIVPHALVAHGTTVGGLSGIDYDACTQRYLAISDDRSTTGPARFYGLRLDLSRFVRSGSPGHDAVSFTSVTTILRPDGTPFPANEVDPESLRLHPSNGHLLWSNEGQRTAAGMQNPTVREMARDGSHVRDFAVPDRYKPAGSAAGRQPADRGIANNLAFEALTISTDGRTLYTATENALVQDGPPATLAAGSNARILAFDLASGAAGAEFAYPVSPVANAPGRAGDLATNGLVELLAMAPGELLAVERSFSAGAATPGSGPSGAPTGNTIRLFHVDIRDASDISGLDSLVDQRFTAARKTLLLDLSELHNDDGSALALDNIEAVTLGPLLPDGRRSLVLVSDNNFSPSQFTQFIALAWQPVSAGAAAARCPDKAAATDAAASAAPR